MTVVDSFSVAASIDKSSDNLDLTKNALSVLESRYLKREDGAVIETPKQLFRRVADHVAQPEEDNKLWSDRFYDLMVSRKFMPNSPTLMNAGRRLGALSACYVLPVPDDTKGIFKAISETAIIQKAGGGTGFAFDELRPCGSYVKSSGGRASGPISFWRVFSEATSAIQQGSFRRGANMAMMRINHPDIFKFLFVKQDLKQFDNYNVSVKIPDKWMETFNNFPDSPFTVVWEGRSWYVPREIIDRCKKAVSNGIAGKAQPRELDVCYGVNDLLALDEHDSLPKDIVLYGEVMDLIVEHAWQTGEPGVCFIDRIQEHEATPELGHIEATNPCSEQPLLPNESCNLGSINLGQYVKAFYENGAGVGALSDMTENSRIKLVDWDALEQGIVTAVRFLDNVVTVNKYPTAEITEMCLRNRKIGLGVMGFADALIKLGVQYDSKLGLAWGEKLMRFVNDVAQSASASLGKEKGEFPERKRSKWRDTMRNACVTSIAPTGSISIIANASGGIEPWFSFVFLRQVLNGKKLMEVQSDFKKISELCGFASKDINDHIYERGTLQDRDDVPEVVKRLFRTARDISPEYHVKMQAAFQKHVTSAVSKTINLPSDASMPSVSDAYMLAWKQGCKGVTVYRDGSRAGQPMALKSSGTAAPGTNGKVATFKSPVYLNLPLPSIRFHYKSTHGSLHFHITLEPISDGRFREREVFFNLGRSGDGVHPITEVYGRLASMALRLDAHLETIIDQMRCHVARLEKINGHTGGGTSLPSELAMGLLEYMKSVAPIRDLDGFLTEFPTFGEFAARKCSRAKPAASEGSQAFITRVSRAAAVAGTFRSPCATPGCSGELVYSEGCHKCVVCGEGRCS